MNFVSKINGLYEAQSEESLINSIIECCGKEAFRPKLDQIKELLAQDIIELEKNVRVIVIAGTNGKGETAHNLRHLLVSQGQNFFMWSSPHVLTILERFVLNDSPISYKVLGDAFFKYRPVAEKFELSFYEFLFYLFIKIAKEVSNLDYIILEVGLGGRFDAVNIFSNPLCAITSISRDHTQILGNKLSDILFEKYGITRSGGKLYSCVEQEHLKSLLTKWVQRDEIQLNFIERGSDYIESNRNLAIALYKELCGAYPKKDICWPATKGRREKVTIQGRNFIFIGAHNLDGHRKMLKTLESERATQKCDVVVLGFSKGREDQVDKIVSLYEDSYPCLFSTRFLSAYADEKSMPKEFIREITSETFNVLENWKDLLDESYKGKNIYIVGSYYLISEVQRFLFSLNSEH